VTTIADMTVGPDRKTDGCPWRLAKRYIASVVPRTSLPPAAIPVLLTLAALLALAPGACGRTNLNTFVEVSGSAGNVGTAGIGGAAGTFGTAGTFSMAGSFGTAGVVNTAGTIGAEAGVFGQAGTAAGTGPATCVEGTNTCADANTGEICMGGVFQTFFCPMGCFNGVCAECVPGSTRCTSGTAWQFCGPTGFWQPSETCAGTCENGACVGCADGATRCASHEGQQTCKGGQWMPAVDCPFVCVGDACGMTPRHVFVTSQTVAGGNIGGIPGADDICRTLAVSANLGTSFIAWLSDDTSSPVGRFAEDAGPYVLVDGSIVANNWTDLTSGTLRHPIDTTELGGPPPTSSTICGNDAVWTDTDPNGIVFQGDASCDGWSNLMGTTAGFGSTTATAEWTDMCLGGSAGGTPTCLGTAPLFCFEQ
jgi:hypothetical protein